MIYTHHSIALNSDIKPALPYCGNTCQGTNKCNKKGIS